MSYTNPLYHGEYSLLEIEAEIAFFRRYKRLPKGQREIIDVQEMVLYCHAPPLSAGRTRTYARHPAHVSLLAQL